ncbi:MAG: transcriptional repressor [Clostridium sp.]
MKTLKYSRQRESIKACLMERRDHPTADALYTSIREQFPNISLGTVYRNLNLLVDLGEIQKLACGDGTDHFDYDTSPHYHYVCKKCGSIVDIPMNTAVQLEEEAKKYVDGTIEDHTVFFYGLCGTCSHGLSS